MNNHRAQPELKCCGNCKHCRLGGDHALYYTTYYLCYKTPESEEVKMTAICDDWESENEQDMHSV